MEQSISRERSTIFERFQRKHVNSPMTLLSNDVKKRVSKIFTKWTLLSEPLTYNNQIDSLLNALEICHL